MDARFVATPSAADLQQALACWPELASRQIRPYLVTAFGDVFVETREGPVLLVDALELAVDEVAPSVDALNALLADSEWASERLLVDVVVLADERGVTRAPEQVFAVAPHPRLGGSITVDSLLVMSLPAWHTICASIRSNTATD